MSQEQLEKLMGTEEEPDHEAERTHTHLGVYAAVSYTHLGDTAFFVAYAGINEFDQSFGDTGFCHDIS